MSGESDRIIRRLSAWRAVFHDDDPVVYILAPSKERPAPAGDTRRGTAWIFRNADDAARFAEWMRGRHNLRAVPVAVHLRELAGALADRDLTWVLDPDPTPGYGKPRMFKSPLAS
jgi:hypothetical protein